MAEYLNGMHGTGLVDENGLPYGVKHVNNKPRVSKVSAFAGQAGAIGTCHLRGWLE